MDRPALSSLAPSVLTLPRETYDQIALKADLSQASNLQATLLPKLGLCVVPWETYYDYAPARKVGGDYCDLVASDTGDLFFFFGDAMGKGITGSIIVSHLHALFRTLVSVGMPIHQMIERANRLLCDSMLTDYYATLVCGRASSGGALELINAGHLPPLVLRLGQAIPLVATGVPLGLFNASTYEVTRTQLAPGETIFFYTDGITEARNPSGLEYSQERFERFVAQRNSLSAEVLVRECVADVMAFTAYAELSDDRTLMALRRG